MDFFYMINDYLTILLNNIFHQLKHMVRAAGNTFVAAVALVVVNDRQFVHEGDCTLATVAHAFTALDAAGGAVLADVHLRYVAV